MLSTGLSTHTSDISKTVKTHKEKNMDLHIETRRGGIIDFTVPWVTVLIAGLTGALITGIAVFRPGRGN